MGSTGASSDGSPEDLLHHVRRDADILVPLANGEPGMLVDVLEKHQESLSGVRIHQMHALKDRPYIHGEFGDRLRHVSYFLSAATRDAYWAGECDLVPSHFSEMPALLRRSCHPSLVIARAAPPDAHGFFSLGTNADYTAAFIGHANGEWPSFGGVSGCDLTAGRAVLDQWWGAVDRTESVIELPLDVAADLLAAYGLEYGSLEPIWAGDTGGQSAVRSSVCNGALYKLLPLTDRDAFDLSGPGTDGVLRVARLLDDQPDVREIEVGPGRAPRIAVGPRRGTVDDPWVRRFSHDATEGSTV